MIIRQILRLIIYYLMPLIFISIFYSIIAKTLFQTRDVMYSPNSSSRSIKSDSNNEKTRSMNIELHNIVRHNRKLVYNNHPTTIVKQDLRTRKQLQARQKVAKTVLFLCLVFFVCWLPKQLHDLYWYVFIYKNKDAFQKQGG